MELELKHLTPYLPYGLTVRTSEGATELIGYSILQGRIVAQLDYDGKDLGLDDPFKPILRPLSDLTKDEFTISMFILRNFEKDNVFNSSIAFGREKERFIYEFIKNFNIDTTRYCYLIYLFSQHFDVFNLIENNLAIDINTLTKTK